MSLEALFWYIYDFCQDFLPQWERKRELRRHLTIYINIWLPAIPQAFLKHSLALRSRLRDIVYATGGYDLG